MTFEEANNGNVNPFFGIKDGCDENCQVSVAVFEARLKGFNVRAKPYDTRNLFFRKLAKNPEKAFIDPVTRTHPEWIESPKFKDWKHGLKYIKKTVKPSQRYIMMYKWKTGRGHVISVLRTKNRFFFYDPQNWCIFENKDDFEDLLKNIDFETVYSRPTLLRVDTLQFDENMLKSVIEDANG